MAQLNQFNGGLNIRLAPHIIGVNEAVVYKNVDNSSISLRPIKSITDENLSVNKYFINFKDAWISSNSYRNYKEFKEKLYYSDGVGKPQKSSDGVSWYNLGIDKPSTKSTTVLNGSGVLNGTYQYCYTFYNSSDGTESQPSEYSDEIVATNNKITLSGVGSGDPQVDIVRVYRLGGNLTSMTLVVEVPNPGEFVGSYTDNIDDLDVDGHILDTFNNAPAPTGLKYLTEHNVMFFGCIDDKLYYSDVAYVNYWSSFNFIDFDDVITGLGATANGLLVFTKYKTYIVTGTSPLTLSKYLISSNQGCLDHKSISFAKNTLLWASTDGICASSGGDVIVFSRDKLGKISLVDIRDSKVYDDVYYLAYGNKLIALDTRFGNILREVTQEVDSLSIYNDKLYYTLSGNLYSLFTNSNYMSLEYKSPKLSDGQLSNLKNYKTIYVRCLGELEVKVYIDDALVTTKSINSKTSEILIPQQSRQGYYIQFEVTGTGELLELQYIVEGRTNGR